MTPPAPREPQTTNPGPPPPFDPELAPALAPLAAVLPPAILPSMISSVRHSIAGRRPSDEDLARGGAIEVREHRIPGPPGAPDVSPLICRPRTADFPRPAVYFTHLWPGGFHGFDAMAPEAALSQTARAARLRRVL
ncbi:hypothetical protein ACIQOW_21535 [Kitasatospora sp. NPDC091335]|uniref:hypothetical protein n=1 Tax=Kitasatospora sp. NPDC091335 TaxID=3364085 RepID=UPI00380B26FF